MDKRDFIRTSAMSAGAVAASGILTARGASGTGGKSRKIRIGQLGVGHAHASERLSSLKGLADEFEIVGVVAERPDSKEITRGGKSSKIYNSFKWMTEEELLETPGLEAVMVETSNRDLVPAARRCMEKGLAICMDKPGGENLEEYRKLLDGCRSRKLPFQIAYMLRKNPGIRFIQKAVREGWLGDIHEIQASMSHNYGNAEYLRYLGDYPGGTMFLLGCHHIDWITSMLGRPGNVTAFMGSTKKAAGKGKNNCLAVLEYPHTLASIHVSDSEVEGLENRRIKISGTNGTIELSPIERFNGSPLLLKLRLKEKAGGYAKGTHTVDLGIRRDRYVDQLKEFGAIVRGEMDSPFTYDHDLLVQEILLSAAGYTSWSSSAPAPQFHE
jgi:predicted dehydrogenase